MQLAVCNGISLPVQLSVSGVRPVIRLYPSCLAGGAALPHSLDRLHEQLQVQAVHAARNACNEYHRLASLGRHALDIDLADKLHERAELGRQAVHRA